jgi:hypothetical protein
MIRLTLAIALLLAAAIQPLAAHDRFRVIGTLVSVQDGWVKVTMKDGGMTISIDVDNDTEMSRDAKPIKLNELLAGNYVVIDAWGDDYASLLALNIRVVPPPE